MSSGERKWRSLKSIDESQKIQGNKKPGIWNVINEWSEMIQPKMVIVQSSNTYIQSKVKWEKTCLNIGEPSSKAKYEILSDSEKYRKGMLKRR